MNWLDFVLLIAIAYAAWKGFRTGLIIELFTLLALIVGIYMAINFSDYASHKIEDDFEIDRLYLAPLAFLITFLVVGACVYFLGKTLEKVVKTTGLSPMNKIAGIAFSCLKMLYLLSAGLIFIETLEERQQWEKREWKENSLVYSPILNLGKTTIPQLKESTIFIQNALKDESDDTGLSIEQILKAKKVADSLGIEAKDAQKIREIHQEYNAK